MPFQKKVQSNMRSHEEIELEKMADRETPINVLNHSAVLVTNDGNVVVSFTLNRTPLAQFFEFLRRILENQPDGRVRFSIRQDVIDISTPSEGFYFENEDRDQTNRVFVERFSRHVLQASNELREAIMSGIVIGNP